METGDIIRILRQKKGMSQTELAEELDLSRSSVGMYERNERAPSREVYENLADYFNVDVDYLMGRTDKITVLPERLDYENKNLNGDGRFLLDRLPSMTPENQNQSQCANNLRI